MGLRAADGRFTREYSLGNKNAVKHGSSHTKLYAIWRHIKNRCYGNDPQHRRYYAERGIKMCERWLNSFENFQGWAISCGYKDGLTIDRINVNGDYSPENCRWATRREQSNNRRVTLFLTLNGITRALSDWAEVAGLPYHVVFKRYKQGWNAERIINTPLQTRKSHRRGSAI
jgi:hypothetical protein